MRIKEADTVIESWLDEEGFCSTETAIGIRLAKTVYELVIYDLNKHIGELEKRLAGYESAAALSEEEAGKEKARQIKAAGEDVEKNKQIKAAGERYAKTERTCTVCGKHYIGGHASKYCDECRGEKKKERNRINEKKRREKMKALEEKKRSDNIKDTAMALAELEG